MGLPNPDIKGVFFIIEKWSYLKFKVCSLTNQHNWQRYMQVN